MSVSETARPIPRPSQLKTSARSVRNGVSRSRIASDQLRSSASGPGRYEDGDEHHEREHAAGRPKCTSWVREKPFTGLTPLPGNRLPHAETMAVAGASWLPHP